MPLTSARDPASRVLRLLALLQTGRAWAGADLARRLEVSQRTLRRDVDRLREFGYAVTGTPGPGGSYRLGAGAVIPPLPFDDAEVVAVVAGLRLVETQFDDDAAHRALLRLRQVLSRRLSARLSGAAASIEVLDEGSPVVDATTVATLGDAVDAGRVRFRYQDRHGNPSIRIVEPHRQVNRAGRWYLVGFDVDACAWRVFRLDRITAVERLAGTFRRRPLPRGTVAAYLASDFDRDGATSR